MRLSTLLQTASAAVLVSRLMRGAPLRATRGPVPPGLVSVVVPARNEAARIARCLDSLDMGSLHEVIVVDDASDDDTAAIATAHGAKVIGAPPLPEGWVGKPWALQCGLEAATGDYVICLDADVVAGPALTDVVVHQLDSCDLVSLTPAPECASRLDAAVHASLLASLVYRFGSRPTSHTRIFVNGQCLGFRRHWLIEEGGFALAAGNMTDDVALARALHARGAHISLLDGSEHLRTRMYESARETYLQWPRSLPMNDCSSPGARLMDTAFLWVTMVLPVLRLAARRPSAVDLLTLLLRWGVAIGVAKRYESRAAVTAPLFDVASVLRLSWTTARPVTRWRSRTYG